MLSLVQDLNSCRRVPFLSSINIRPRAKCISPKMILMARVKFELTYKHVTVSHVLHIDPGRAVKIGNAPV